MKPKRPTKRKKAKLHVLKVKRPVKVPPLDLPPDHPVRDLVDALEFGEVAEIKLVNPEPTRWERIRKWWAGE